LLFAAGLHAASYRCTDNAQVTRCRPIY